MKYLVTGGAGFIGSHIVQRLLVDGHQVRVLDDLSTGREENLAPYIGEIDFVRGSVTDGAVVASALDGVDGVFHQAAIPSVPRSIAAPLVSHRSIVDGTLTLLEEMRVRGHGRIVFASSSSVYGETATLPKTEDMRPSPLSPYAAAKLSAEQYAMIYARHYGINAVGLRYFNVFGPRQDPKSEYAAVIPRFVTAVLAGRPPVIFGDGLQTRDFTYIDNVVDANLLAMKANVGGDVVNIAGGAQTSLLDVVASIGRILGVAVSPTFAPNRAGDIRDSYASIDRARQVIGFNPQIDFATGLERTVAFFVAQQSTETAPTS